MNDDLRDEGIRYLSGLGMKITDELPRVDFKALKERKENAENMR